MVSTEAEDARGGPSARGVPRADDLLRLLSEATASVTGELFFRTLVRNLALLLGVHETFVAAFGNDRSRIAMLAHWSKDYFVENTEYILEGTPCEVVLHGEARCFPQGVCNLFPRDQGLRRQGAESYLAIPLLNARDEVLGHLAAVDTKPMEGGEFDLRILQIFGARAAGELERQQMEAGRRAHEQRLSRILSSALDAIICFDEQRRVNFFNPAAEKIFGCAAAWALGQPFDRFLTKSFRATLVLLSDLNDDDITGTWRSEGLTALRANGEQFAIEATISRATQDGSALYTVILRDVEERTRAARELQRLGGENELLKRELMADRAPGLIGESAPMQAVTRAIAAISPADTTVLIYGETGVGKELVAHAIHRQSRRAERLLVKVNCAALPAELIESELFGHEKGAFTGATSQRKGRFELADKGTLFLDEVGELTPAAQAKLLRVLQEQEFERVGGAETVRVDVRVVTATNRSLAEQVAQGSFRADLYYRLNVFPITVPPLRARGEDVVLLAQHFLQHVGRKLGKSFHGIAPSALNRLVAYAWPGNVRELQNIIERAAILSNGPQLEIPELLGGTELAIASQPEPITTPSADSALASFERSHIKRVLEECRWVIEGAAGAAQRLQLEPSTLRYRMRKLGLARPRN